MMKVYTNDVPRECEYLTNGKHYGFTPDDSTGGIGYITDDMGDKILILTELQEWGRAYLDEISAWKIVE